MSIKNLESIYDLVQDGKVDNMRGQTGPAFPIVGPDVERGIYPGGSPLQSQLHAGPKKDTPGRSLVGPNYQGVYGSTSSPSILDNDGITPDKYEDNLPEGLEGPLG